MRYRPPGRGARDLRPQMAPFAGPLPEEPLSGAIARVARAGLEAILHGPRQVVWSFVGHASRIAAIPGIGRCSAPRLAFSTILRSGGAPRGRHGLPGEERPIG